MESSQLPTNAHNNATNNERVTVSDAVSFVRNHTGFEFEERTFRRWCESGCIKVNDLEIEIETIKVGKLWFITRRSLERLIANLQT